MKNYLKIASMCIFALALTACNTIDGAGQDVEEAGETIHEVLVGKRCFEHVSFEFLWRVSAPCNWMLCFSTDERAR